MFRPSHSSDCITPPTHTHSHPHIFGKSFIITPDPKDTMTKGNTSWGPWSVWSLASLSLAPLQKYIYNLCSCLYNIDLCRLLKIEPDFLYYIIF